MLIFDASNRDQCEVKRSSTNTPLQSLVLMNDYQVLEAARNLAIKTQNDKTDTDTKLGTLFRKILCRTPKSNELQKIRAYHQTTLAAMNDKKANNILSFGDFKTQPEVDIKGAAAMMQTVQLLFNLEETSTR